MEVKIMLIFNKSKKDIMNIWSKWDTTISPSFSFDSLMSINKFLYVEVPSKSYLIKNKQIKLFLAGNYQAWNPIPLWDFFCQYATSNSFILIDNQTGFIKTPGMINVINPGLKQDGLKYQIITINQIIQDFINEYNN